MEHQEGAGELRRRAREGGEPILFGIAEFESNSEFMTTSYSNLTSTSHTTSVLDVLHMHRKLRR
jgi:hypothetical protein